MRMAKDGCEASHFRPLNHIPVFSLRCVRRAHLRLNKSLLRRS